MKSQNLHPILARLVSYLVLAVMLVLFFLGFFIFTYIFIFMLILAAVLFLIAYVRAKFFGKKFPGEMTIIDVKAGRLIEQSEPRPKKAGKDVE